MPSEKKRDDSSIKGGCCCGAVRFEIAGKINSVTACHCQSCRKLTGHFVVTAQTMQQDVHFERQDGLSWYSSSDHGERGFCKNCGSALFYHDKGKPTLSVLMGSLEGSTQRKIEQHIFASEKGDYYEIEAGVPVYPLWPDA